MSDHHNEEDWIVLVDEDGQEYRYSMERAIEVEDKKYVILIPEIQESEHDEEAHVFRLETDEKGEEILVDVEDEELDKIQQLLEDEESDGDLSDEDQDDEDDTNQNDQDDDEDAKEGDAAEQLMEADEGEDSK